MNILYTVIKIFTFNDNNLEVIKVFPLTEIFIIIIINNK